MATGGRVHELFIEDVVKVSDAPTVHEGAATLTATGSLSPSGAVIKAPAATARAEAPAPTVRVHAEVGLDRTKWEMSCVGFGALLGAPFGNKGMLLGGVTAYFWGRHKYPDAD
jgi:hypothetical protein